MPESRRPSLEDPRLLPFLPMLYIAWADGDLAGDEIRRICVQVSGTEGLEVGCRNLLGRWLDPDDPPSASELQDLLVVLRRRAAELADSDRRSLSSFGLELARRGGGEPAEPEERALAEVERALGLVGTNLSGFFQPARRKESAHPAPPSFDVAAMTRRLDGDHHALRAELRALLCEERFRIPHGLDRKAHRERVLDLLREIAGRGYGSLGYPESVGGKGDLSATLAVAETLGYGDLSLFVKFGVQFGLFGGSILQLGTERHHKRWLAAAGSLDLPGCFAMTESGHGSNVAELETTARYDAASGEFIVHTPHRGARKDYIGNAAAHGRLATVFAQLEVGGERHGVHALMVSIRDEMGRPLDGIEIEDCGHKMGLNGVDNGRLTFHGVRVPRENLLDRFGRVAADGTYSSPIASPTRRFFTMLGTLVGGRVTVAMVSLSAAKSALAIAVRYAEGRRQFGPEGAPETPLLDYRTHQRRLLPRLAATYALDFALEDLGKRYLAAPDDDRRGVEALAAGLKAIATWHATDTIQECREACGGNGYLAANRFADLKADTDVFTTFEGDNIVLLQLVAKSLLTGFKKQFHDMGVFALLRYVVGRAARSVAELSPIHGDLSDAELGDRAEQIALLRWREESLVAALAMRFKKRIDRGVDPFQAVVECQAHMVEAARASVERVVLERFAAAIDGEEGLDAVDQGLRPILGQLADLHALERIDADRGFFLEHGAFGPSTAKRIRKRVDALCLELRPQAKALVDAFGIPDALLAAPIAVDPGEASRAG